MQLWPHISQTDPECSGGGEGLLGSGAPGQPSSQLPSRPTWRSQSVVPPGSYLPPSVSRRQPRAKGPRPPWGAV
eukprot:3334891-Rhodomonas_salina.1